MSKSRAEMSTQIGTLTWYRQVAEKVGETPAALRPPPKLIRQWLRPLAEAIDEERRKCKKNPP